jgi:Cytochrome P460
MNATSSTRYPIRATAAIVALLSSVTSGLAATPCLAVKDTPQLPPPDKAFCRSLEHDIRRPSALPLDRYEEKLGTYVRNFCYRDPASGWRVDKHIRNTGPYIASLRDDTWTGRGFGTHPAVLVWYSAEMYDWLKANRPETARRVAEKPVPDRSVIIKEMYSPPAAACADIDYARLQPDQGVALMVRDRKASHDGWFWGWFGWKQWVPDWPAPAGNPFPNMGFGQYCTNCHASAKDNSTFASLRNIKGEPGEPLVFLSQDFFLDPSWRSQHSLPAGGAPLAAATPGGYSTAFLAVFGAPGGAGPAPTRDTVAKLPSETYDNVFVPARGARRASTFVTSDQCIGCHDARGTGLQFDMTEPAPHGLLWNVSPYATWRTSPMGLSGRDPIFFARLASETETFHRGLAATVEDTCLGCHGIGGQRQFIIDRYAATGSCEKFSRRSVDAVPYPGANPQARMSSYGALARDGITCAACHHMVLGKDDGAKYRDAPQNKCVSERQAFLNPDLTGFARTFTGSFLLGAPDVLFGPFSEPKPKPMKNALGITPEHYRDVRSAELCGSCHVVHLPVLHRDKVIGHVFEQTTYAEWAFSDYRTGTTPDGGLPSGPGALPQTCQDCHMPSRDADGKPYRSKIAGIQEYSNFPQAEHTLAPRDIDLGKRDGYAKHTLAGLNLFLNQMAQQFPDVLGIRTQDPMLTDAGVDPLRYTEKATLDQAGQATASIAIDDIAIDAGALRAAVTVTNKAGHKFPSGVGFRRAFIEFSVLDDRGGLLWSSGRTDDAGVIVDGAGTPVAGELWWSADCSARIAPEARAHQPHFQTIGRQDQAQIYEELVSAPPDVAAPVCGGSARPTGALTTSFLSICTKVKDNRILPHGFLPTPQRNAIAAALGAGRDLAEEAGPHEVGDDADYRTGGADTLVYRVPLADIAGAPASLRATLYYQATPPYFLQDRFCTSKSPDTKRLYFLAGNLDLDATPARNWKLEVVTTGTVALPR